MKLMSVAAGVALLCAAPLAAQEIRTVTTETTKFTVTDGKDVTVSGCVDRFDDGGYLLTDDVGDLKYVLVTNEDLSKYVGHRVEVKGLSTDGGDAKLKIEKEVGTSGEIAGRKTDDHKIKRTKELEGDVGFPYVGVKSMKKISNSCR
jgi:hypothetical protein